MKFGLFYVLEAPDGDYRRAWTRMMGQIQYGEELGYDAALGRVDYRAVGLENFGKADNYLEPQVEPWRGQLASYGKSKAPMRVPVPARPPLQPASACIAMPSIFCNGPCCASPERSRTASPPAR